MLFSREGNFAKKSGVYANVPSRYFYVLGVKETRGEKILTPLSPRAP